MASQGQQADTNLRKRRRDEPNLFRARKAMIRLHKEAGTEMEGGRKKSEPKPIGRKAKRKQARAEKKVRKHNFYTKKGKNKVEEEKSNNVKTDDSNKAVKVQKKKKKKRKKRKLLDENKNISQSVDDYTKEAMTEANKREEKEIKKLEKQLNIKKKRKNLPKAFRDEGLDYLLELCESPSTHKKDVLDTESSDVEMKTENKIRIVKDKDVESDEALESDGFLEDSSDAEHDSDHSEEDDPDLNDDLAVGENLQEDTDNLQEEEEDVEEDDDSTDDEDDDNISTDEEGSDIENEPVLKKSRKENIYGESEGKYVPPHMRLKQMENTEKKNEQLEKLKRQVKGLVNRLSESNLPSITSQLEDIFMKNSRNDMNELLSEMVFSACISSSLMSDRLCMEHMQLIAVLNAHIGSEIGAFFLQKLAVKFSTLYEQGGNFGEGKEIDNVVCLLAYLYCFKVVHCTLIYDIIRKLVEGFTERDIELLLLLLKRVGISIRRDDPGALKEIILQVQAKVATNTAITDQSRVRYMLETITALRNNNLRKIPNYDHSELERLSKTLKSIIKDSGQCLNVSLEDLINAESKGRWWIVGSAWSGREKHAVDNSSQYSGDSEILELARKQRMNNDIRKNIFCVLMTSEDYIDAFEKILKLNLKDKQGREIVRVLIDCCLQEKLFNPYYSYLAQKLCEYNRSFQVTFQYCLWDRFKTLASLTEQNRTNLALLISHLCATKAISLSVLKVVNFGELDKISIKFFQQLFSILLTKHPENVTRATFSRISSLTGLNHLREGLKLFIQHFLAPRDEMTLSKKDEILKKRVDVAVEALQGL